MCPCDCVSVSVWLSISVSLYLQRGSIWARGGIRGQKPLFSAGATKLLGDQGMFNETSHSQLPLFLDATLIIVLFLHRHISFNCSQKGPVLLRAHPECVAFLPWSSICFSCWNSILQVRLPCHTPGRHQNTCVAHTVPSGSTCPEEVRWQAWVTGLPGCNKIMVLACVPCGNQRGCDPLEYKWSAAWGHTYIGPH